MTRTDNQPIEYDLIEQASLAEISVLETKIAPTTADDKHVRIEGRLGLEEDDDGEPSSDVEHYAFGLVQRSAGLG